MIKYQYIETDSEIRKFINYLHSEGIRTVAMDFEGEFSLHQYGEALCLIQIYDGRNSFIIDPVKISAGELKKLLETRDIVKLFYDAQSDKALVFKKYGIEILSVFDLADLVWILEGQGRGLDAMIGKYLQITLSQKKKFQRHNWTVRPVNNEALEYALQDVQYLFQLKDELLKNIIEKGLFEDYIHRLVTKDYQVRINPVPGIKRKKEYKKLSREQKRIFDRIFDVRDRQAEKLNWPPNNVISNADLIGIARGDQKLEDSIPSKVPRKSRIDIIGELEG
ncbi:MAG: ribonuclease D [Spirochaetales bacterium]|nr:ribonuclease D [Spirochaetales bacterium]